MSILGYVIEALEKGTEILYRYKLALACASCGFSWLFSLLEVTHCSFLGSMESRERFGLFSRSFTDQKGEFLGCIRYGGHEVDEFDASMRAGRAFGVLTLLYLTMVMVSPVCCVFIAPRTANIFWRANRFLLCAATLSQMLTLLAASSRVCSNLQAEACELVGVGILGIFNIVVLMLLCVTFWSLDPPESISKWLRVVNLDAQRQPDPPSDSNFIRNCVGKLSARDPTRFRLVFTLLTFLALVMSAITVGRCTFLMVNATGYGLTSISSGLGLYSQAVQVQGSFVGCVAYPTSFSFDPPFKTARFFATVAVLLASGAFVVASISLFRKQSQRVAWLAMRALLPLSSFSLLLSTTALSSDNCSLQGVTSCRLGSAGVLLIFMVVLLAFLSIIVWIQPHPASHLIEFTAEAKDDVEQQSSKDETVVVGNPRLMHKHEPILEEEEGISDSDEERTKDKIVKNQRSFIECSNDIGSISTSDKEDEHAAIFRDSDDESSTLSSPSFVSQEVTYHIEYIGNTKKTTKTIATSNGVLSEVTTVEKVEEDSYDCGVSVESYITE